MNQQARFNLTYFAATLLAIMFFQGVAGNDGSIATIPYSEFRSLLHSRQIAEVAVTDDKVRGMYEDLWGRELDAKKGLTVVEIINAIHEGQIRPCISWARIRPCPTPTSTTPARRWPCWSIWWCRISS